MEIDRHNEKDEVATVTDCNAVDLISIGSCFDDTSGSTAIHDRYSQSASNISNGKNGARSTEIASNQSIKSICSKIDEMKLGNAHDISINYSRHSDSNNEQSINNFWWDYRDTLRRESELEARLLLKDNKITKVIF